MNTITENSWRLLWEIRTELKLDSFYSPEKRYEPNVEDWHGPPVAPPIDPLIFVDDKPRPGELLRIDWIRREFERTGKALSTIKQRMNVGYYDHRLEFRRVSDRRVYVKEKGKLK